ncbi:MULTISPECIES: hypothetical protein [unclassified Companilactobacillus]|jgi:hypothetical protein|uniref:hypothetical protein n=1 Tax=unclassified Companilactobacillus TaxID=2767904 RepID=UPI002FEF6A67
MDDKFRRHVVLVKVGVNFGISNLSILDFSSLVTADQGIEEVDKTKGWTLGCPTRKSNIDSH